MKLDDKEVTSSGNTDKIRKVKYSYFVERQTPKSSFCTKMIRSNTGYNLCIKLTSKISQDRTIITIIKKKHKKTGPSDKTVFIDLEFDLAEQLFSIDQ